MRSILAAFVTVLATSAVVSTAVRDVTLPAGTMMRIRLDNGIGSDLSRIEDAVSGHLVSPSVVNGGTVVASGAPVTGAVTQAIRSGKLRGRARIAMRFHTMTASDRRYDIQTRTWTAVAPGTKKKDAATIGLPAVGGAIVGGLI